MSQTSSSRQPSLFTRISKRIAVAAGVTLSLAPCIPASAQMQLIPEITTIAGTGSTGYTGDNGPATGAQFSAPVGMVLDSVGNIYIGDAGNHVVRKIDASTGVITTFAGTGVSGNTGDGGPASSAELVNPGQLAMDRAGNLYIADVTASVIRKVTAGTGIITTYAGTGVSGYTGDNGPATSAEISNQVQGLTVDSAGNLYIADSSNQRIRMVSAATQIITTVAGTGTNGFSGDEGPATSAELAQPAGLAVDSLDNLYISFLTPASTGNRIRVVNQQTGIITTVAGNGTLGETGDGGPATSAELDLSAGVAVDSAGNIYIAERIGRRIRKVSNGIITTIAGNGIDGYTGDGGAATLAELHQPVIAIGRSGSVLISDSSHNVIRKLFFPSFATTNVGSASAALNFYLQATAAETITSITAPQSQGGKQEYSIGTINGCTIDGATSNPADTLCTAPITFTPAYPGQRWVPLQVVTSTGNINFGLQGTGVGPLVALTPGIVSTVAGTGVPGNSGDGGAATSAQMQYPSGVAIDGAGNLYIADPYSFVIRRVDAVTHVITTVAGDGTFGYSGDGGAATSAQLSYVYGIAIDAAGNLYLADSTNGVIRKVDAATHVITTVAGTGATGFSGDGGLAINAQLYNPIAVAVDAAGSLFITDFYNERIRKVSPAGIITTVAGSGLPDPGNSDQVPPGYSGDGGPATSAQLYFPYGLAVDSAGNLYIADTYNQAIRKVDLNTGIITTLAGNGTAGNSGDGGPATSAQLNYPYGVTVDSANDVYVGDTNNGRIRKVNAVTGTITTIPASGIVYTRGVTLDGTGNIYIAGGNMPLIYKLDVSQSALSYPTATTVGTSDTTDNPRSVILSNIGNADLTIPPPSSGNNPNISSSFLFDSVSTCPELLTSSSAQTLASGADCTIAIDFEPVQAGALTGTAVVTDTSLNLPAASQTIHLTATGVAAATATTVTSSLNPSVYTQSITFTATIAPTTGTAVPTGTMQFSLDGTLVGGLMALNNGAVAYTTSTLAVGAHVVKAVYAPDTGNFTTSTGSLSQMVNKIGTTTTLTSSLNPSKYGNSVTFTASVPAPATGTVQFLDGTTLLGTGTVANGVATLTTSALVVGTHPVTAVYSGNADYNSATSPAYNQVVTAQAAVLDFTLTLTSAGTQTVIPGNAGSYTVQVAPTNVTYPGTMTFSATGLPTGATISFSPATVAPDGGITPSKVKVQTAQQRSALNIESVGSVALALLMLPLVTSRRIRRSSRQYFYLLILVLGGIGASAGLTGCGYNGNGFFGQAPQTYNITITATSRTIQHSVNVTLNVQ